MSVSSILLPGDVSAEALLRSVLDVSLTGFMLFRPVYNEAADTILDFAYEYLNPAAQQMLHLPQRPSESFLARYPMAGPAGIFAFYREAFLVGQRQKQAFNYQSDGLDGYFYLAAQRQGPLLVVSFTDTNEQPRSAVEEALRQSQAREQQARTQAEAGRQRFYDVLLHLPALVAVYEGPELVYTFVNESYQRYFPAPVQLFGRSLREVLPEAAGQGVVARLEHVYHTGEPYYVEELEVWLDHSGGGQRSQQVFLNLLFHPLRNAQGQVTSVLDYSYDVTTQVRARRQVEHFNQALEARVQERTSQLEAAQAATERQRRQWYALFRLAPVGICIFDGPEWVCEFVNPDYQALFPGRALLGKPLVEALPEVADQFLMTTLHRVYNTGKSFEAHEVLVPLARTEDGPVEDIYFDLTYQARRNEAGQIDGFVTYATDVTAQVVARQRVQDLNQELAAINEELTATNEELHLSNHQLMRTNVDLDTFVYTASHDLRAPIANLEGLLSALRKQLPAAVQAEEITSQVLGLMQGALERFRVTIDQLTDVSRLQQAQNLPLEQVQLASVVEDVRLDLLSQLQQAGAALTVDIDPEVCVQFAAKNLRSVVYNLLSNAIKYRQLHQAPRITLRAARVGEDTVRLSVQDNGLGMSDYQVRRLFGLFQRLHTHVEGTGVGLYMVKRMVENAGGTIAVHSEVDVGTTFTVTLRN